MTYEVVDPDRQPGIAKQYEITAYNTIVVEGNGQRYAATRRMFLK